MKHNKTSALGTPKRGRPQKFGRPSQLVAITLPENVIKILRSRRSDLGWAIVELVELYSRSNLGSEPSQPQPVVELAHLLQKRALIVVGDSILREIPGVTMIPLGDGRSFLAFDGLVGVADLEIAILDRIDVSSAGSEERSALIEFRETLRAWRVEQRLRFVTKSILIVDGIAKRPTRSLLRLKTT